MAPLPSLEYVSRDAAISTLADGAISNFCDGQLVVAGSAILLFATLSDSADGTRLETPERLVWRPSRNDYHPEEEIPWLPHATIPQFDHRRKVFRSQLHVLLRKEEERDHWLHCGQGHLLSYQLPNVTKPGERGGPVEYSFPRLPRQRWLEIGGYPGWKVTVNGVSETLPAEDSRHFEARLAQLGDGHGHVSLTRWEGDALSVHFNEKSAFPMYLRDPADSGLYLSTSGDDRLEEFSCACCGIALEFPASATTNRQMAVDLLLRFFRSGVPPEPGQCLGDDLEWGETI